MMRSVTMLRAVLAKEVAVRFMQCLGLMEWSQYAAGGTQAKICVKKRQMKYAITMPIMIQVAILKGFMGKIRRYCSRMESLVLVRATL